MYNNKNHTYYLPTYEECRAICDKYDNFQFYEKISFIDGYKVSTFNYRLVDYNDFSNPLGDNTTRAFEMRGICYVFNLDGTLFKRFLLMEKFFNLNQVENTQLSNIINIPIKDIYDKCDGSVINFIELPNGKILAKSKLCVDNEQAIKATNIYLNSPNIKKMVEYFMGKDIMPIMEYVSPTNRVVLKYKETKLILLRLRDLKTGNYYDLDMYPDLNNIETAQKETNTSWEKLISLSETIKDKEGWVITLESGMMVKLKTKYYFDLHHLTTESIHREDFLIEKVIDDEIDDIISKIELSDIEILAIIDNVVKVTTNYLHNATKKVEYLLDEFENTYNSSRKDFVLNYGKKDKYFGYVMSVISGNEPLLVITEDLKKYTYRLSNAKDFIKNGDF